MEKPLSLVACVSDESILRKNLLASAVPSSRNAA